MDSRYTKNEPQDYSLNNADNPDAVSLWSIFWKAAVILAAVQVFIFILLFCCILNNRRRRSKNPYTKTELTVCQTPFELQYGAKRAAEDEPGIDCSCFPV